MMKSTQDAFPERRAMLIKLLCINPAWRMHQLSDGQRRRVQIFLQLLRPSEILLLDEITTDLDVITRQDFLQFLKVRHHSIPRVRKTRLCLCLPSSLVSFICAQRS
jgi:CCR4-NOT complex subunit CAF16